MAFVIFPFALMVLAIFEQRSLFKISVFITAIYFACTFGYGYDWINYRDTYNLANNPSYDAFFIEPGLYILMQGANYIGLSYGVFSFFLTLFIYFAVYKFCNKLENPSAAFFTIFSFLAYFVFTEWIRQGVAIAIILLSMGLYERGSKFKFTLMIIFASCFHLASLVAFSYLFISSKSSSRMKMFIILASLVMYFVIASIYNPALMEGIPFIGDKFAAYSKAFLDNSVGFWQFVLSSKVILAYILILVLLYRQSKHYKKLLSAISSIYFMLLTRLVSALVRMGYMLVPLFVLSMDEYLTDKGNGLKTKLSKLIYFCLVLGISTIPLWNAVFWEAANSNVTIFSSDNVINREISKKCRIINKYYDVNVIERCR
ncbi:EpsG family protein [Klebsiella pneumoniae]|nr:EpsG family protein [Klebsiella pneumoniae]